MINTITLELQKIWIKRWAEQSWYLRAFLEFAGEPMDPLRFHVDIIDEIAKYEYN